MADRELTPAEIEKLLAGDCLANLATVNRDGSPQVTPVWYGYRDGKFMIITHDNVLKTRNIRRDPRVSLSIATPDAPYAYVLAKGKARMTTDDLEAIVTSICLRYWGPEKGGDFARQIVESGQAVLMEITPDKLASWTRPE